VEYPFWLIVEHPSRRYWVDRGLIEDLSATILVFDVPAVAATTRCGCYLAASSIQLEALLAFSFLPSHVSFLRTMIPFIDAGVVKGESRVYGHFSNSF
jgi:hypothetical protein